MVRLSVGLNASSSRCAQELLDAFRFVSVGTRLEPGCVGVSVWADPDWALHYFEEWETEVGFAPSYPLRSLYLTPVHRGVGERSADSIRLRHHNPGARLRGGSSRLNTIAHLLSMNVKGGFFSQNSGIAEP